MILTSVPRCTSPTRPTRTSSSTTSPPACTAAAARTACSPRPWPRDSAYSNGLRGSVLVGRVGYYAERTPELPQTVRFVVGVIKDGRARPRLGEYVMAQAFVESRASRPTRPAPRASPPIWPTASRRAGAAVPRVDPRAAPRPAARRPALRTQGPRARTHAAGYDAKGLDRSDVSFFVIGRTSRSTPGSSTCGRSNGRARGCRGSTGATSGCPNRGSASASRCRHGQWS